ncbi:Aminobutyraldehyde dehydrogenase [Rubrivivax sp. A210]|uniref:NAD(P)/FAD-dependent oxidoreductase n=1 Tax=Rubrivivax sp. A210 TaxID=2772301 RepID=UPI001917F648|nr:NAD(P)/FAD-dependent oxidoreductase [Rubrivivax sp. A210]CAD5373093.1 Aminobutyraldehyde dehydrogenase [Rubrivivax sp. A210]
MTDINVAVIGAGVVGLAVARTLAQAGHSVVVLEAANAYGTGVSARNSEVIHAGLYYEPGSLKASLCLRGRELLYAYCQARAIAHHRCGKLLVATREEDRPKLAAIAARAAACGVDDLQFLSGDEARALEPALACVAALWSPSSGIVDSHGLMTQLLADAEAAGASLAVASPFAGARSEGRAWRLRSGGAEPFEMSTGWIVNCAGLGAQGAARLMEGFDAARIPPLHLAKGHYFSLAARAPFRHLVYPTPVDGGLGVHLTLDLGGQARFGPDVEWLPEGATPETLDYRVDAARQAGFEADIRRYWPGLPAGALQPDYSGVRPKLSGPGQPARDFHIAGPREHGCEGVVQLFGIESPGLTASLAIAEHVAAILPPP